MSKLTRIGAYQYIGTSKADKPTDCEENTVVLELNTAKIKYFDGEEWREFGEEIVNWVTLYENDALVLNWSEEETCYGALVSANGDFLSGKETSYTIDGETLTGVSEQDGSDVQLFGSVESGYMMVRTFNGNANQLLIIGVYNDWTGETVTVSVKVEQIQ